MAELASLKKQRATNKGRLTNILKFANANDKDASVDDFRARLARVETLMSEFTIIEGKIFTLVPDEESDYVSEENYYNAVASLNKCIRSRTMTANNISPDISLNATQVDHIREIKLPKINIPPFSGDYTEWQSFHDLFASTIHESTSLSAVQKFQYLKGLLRGEAAILLKHISIAESNYIGALNKLKERYDRKRHIVNSFIRTFLDQPSITTANSGNIKRFMDTSDKVIRGLKALGENAETRDHWLIFILVQKLNDKSKLLWAETVTNLENPQFSNFLEFLTRRIDTLESANVSFKKPNAKYNIKSHFITREFNFSCDMCQQKDHLLFVCKEFNEMDVNKRRDWARNNHRCFNCLSSSHLIQRFSSKHCCLQCKKRHHKMLHLPESNTPTATQNSPPEKTEELAALCSQNNLAHSILPTALIDVLSSTGNTLMYRALLDSGLQARSFTEASAQRLGLKKRNSRFSVVGLGGSSAGCTKGSVTVTIRPKHHPELAIEAFVLSKITTALPHQTIENIPPTLRSKFQLADPHFHKSATIDVLIGADSTQSRWTDIIQNNIRLGCRRKNQ